MKNNEGSTMNYSDMKLPELKSLAKDRGVKGYSSLKKADIVQMLEAQDVPKPVVSRIDMIKASIREPREYRSSKGRNASAFSHSASIKTPETKAASFRLQRGSATAKLSARQARRVRKTAKRLAF